MIISFLLCLITAVVGWFGWYFSPVGVIAGFIVAIVASEASNNLALTKTEIACVGLFIFFSILGCIYHFAW